MRQPLHASSNSGGSSSNSNITNDDESNDDQHHDRNDERIMRREPDNFTGQDSYEFLTQIQEESQPGATKIAMAETASSSSPSSIIELEEEGEIMLSTSCHYKTSSQTMLLEESDAEILEKGLKHDEHYISHENTPCSIQLVECAIYDKSHLPLMRLDDEEDNDCSHDNIETADNNRMNTEQQGETNNNTSNNDSRHSQEHSFSGQNQHGIVFDIPDNSETTLNETIQTDYTDEIMVPIPHQQQRQQQQHPQKDLNAESIQNQNLNSKSYHRKLKEFAQYLEALGEAPQDGMMQGLDINDDDEVNDTDDDESENEALTICDDLIRKGVFDNTSTTISINNNNNINDIDNSETKMEEQQCDLDHEIIPSKEKSQNTLRRKMNKFKSPPRVISDGSNDPLNESMFSILENLYGEPVHQNLTEEQETMMIRLKKFFKHRLPCRNTDDEKVPFKGIRHNPPEITKHGIQRGNYAQLHRKAWLEVSDKDHRYGSNLRIYYKHWERLDHPAGMFFDWLDAKGEAEGHEKPEIEECPRSVLDTDRVQYLTETEDQLRYKLTIRKRRSITDGAPLTPYIVDVNGDIVRTGPQGWIFILRDYELYGAEKVTASCGASKSRFHHSSFFGGKAVAAAGIIITDEEGCVKHIYPHSGHYRPGEAHMQRMLMFLYGRGVPLDSFLVDVQQIFHVSREIRDENTPKGGKCDENVKKAKKTNSLHLMPGCEVALFLSHKAKLIRNCVFSKIHQIRSIHTADRKVKKILEVIDQGGYRPVIGPFIDNNCGQKK